MADAKTANLQSEEAEQLINALNGYLDYREKRAPLSRDELLAALHELASATHARSMKILVGGETVSDDELAEHLFAANVAYLGTCAVLRLARSPNTQWSDRELLLDQFRHAVRESARHGKVIRLRDD